MQYRLTLRQKLSLTVAPLMLMGVIISLITWRSLRENATPLIEAQQLRSLALSSLALLLTQDDATKTMMLDPDNPGSNLRKIKAYDENQRVLAQIAKVSSSGEVRKIVHAMTDLDAKVLRDIDTSVLEAVGDNKMDKARQLYFGTYEPKRAEYEAYVRKLVGMAEQNSKLAEARLQRSNSSSLHNILTALAIGLSLVALCLTGLARSVTKSMHFVVKRLRQEHEAAASSTDLIRAASRSVSEGVSLTADSIGEIDQSVSDFAAGLQVTCDHAAFARESSSKAVSNADRASEAIEQLVAATREAERSSHQIISIIKVIDDISFKTNILALNAAVEAARAGQAGLGFSVVADEVRNLAKSSASAAQETADLIQASVEKSKQGFAMSERAAGALAGTITESHRIDGIIGEIASNARSQNENLQQITASLNRIGNVGQKSAQDAEKSHKVAETLTQRTSSMEEVIGELVALVGAPKE